MKNKNPFKTSKPPAYYRDKSNKFNKSERTGRNAWLKFVSNSHLELLMDMVDRMRAGEPMSREDTFHYAAIKEQAEAIMAQAAAEHWTEDQRRVNMIDVWWEKKHVAT